MGARQQQTAAARAAAMGVSRATLYRREREAMAGAPAPAAESAAWAAIAALAAAVDRLAAVLERTGATVSPRETVNATDETSHDTPIADNQGKPCAAALVSETASHAHDVRRSETLSHDTRGTRTSSRVSTSEILENQEQENPPTPQRPAMSHDETVSQASPALPGLGAADAALPVRRRAATVAERLRAVTARVYADPGFRAWWAEYPNKGHKPEAAEAWYLAGATGVPSLALAIRVGLWHWRRTWQWAKDRGAYVPRADRFLAQRLWEDPPDLRRGLPPGSTWVPPDLPRPGGDAADARPMDEDDGAEALAALRRDVG